MFIALIAFLCAFVSFYTGPLPWVLLFALSSVFGASFAWLRVRFSVVTSTMFQRPHNAEDLLPYKPRIFVVEPHGMLCCGLSLLAGPGTKLPPELTRRIHVVAHWSAFLFPIVGALYNIANMIPNCATSVLRCLRKGDSVAVSPSGIAGKNHAVRCADVPGGLTTILRRSRVPGAVRLAADVGAEIVPVLVPDANCTLAKPFDVPRWVPWWLVPTWGRYGFMPVVDEVHVIFGKPIRPDASESIESLADRVYDGLKTLAPAGRRVCIVRAYEE